MEQVEGGDYCSPIRDGPGLRFGVIWKRYVSIVTHRKALHRYGTILFKGSNETVEQPCERMEDPVHVTLNTSPSAMSPCVNNSSGPNNVYKSGHSLYLEKMNANLSVSILSLEKMKTNLPIICRLTRAAGKDVPEEITSSS